jgi:hypothetical protein
MRHDGGAIRDALLRARDTLSVLLREFPETAPRAGELLAALGDIERASAGDGRQSGQSTSRRPGRKPKYYVVETVGNDEFLAEYRADDPRPFRAPRAVFDAVVKVLAKARSPLQASEIRNKAARVLGGEPPDYAVRVCLRFLCSKSVGLVSRHRARYLAGDRHSFPAAAEDALTSLREARAPCRRCVDVSPLSGDALPSTTVGSTLASKPPPVPQPQAAARAVFAAPCPFMPDGF